MPDLSRRDLRPELMDAPDIDPGEHARALVGLARINRLSNSPGILWPPIARLARRQPANVPLRVLDVATGSGDIPISLARRAHRLGIAVTFAGCDISETAVDAASTDAIRQTVPVTFFRHDALADPLPDRYDVVMSSLFLHHLTDENAGRLLRAMRRSAGRMVLVNDLDRSQLGYWAAWVGTRLLTRSPIVHYDGPQSVRAAFTPAEVRQLADRAGLDGARVRRRWPFRWLLEWRGSAD